MFRHAPRPLIDRDGASAETVSRLVQDCVGLEATVTFLDGLSRMDLKEVRIRATILASARRVGVFTPRGRYDVIVRSTQPYTPGWGFGRARAARELSIPAARLVAIDPAPRGL